MTSASSAFATLGVAAGMVAQITLGKTVELFAIDAVASSTITLRRKGLNTGVGLPPGIAAGVTGLTFTINTFIPQIESATRELNRQFGVSSLPGRTPSDLFDKAELRDACVLLLLSRVYLAQARSTGERSDDFAAKAKLFSQEYSDALGRLVIHWNGSSGFGCIPIESQTSRFSTRLSR